MGSQDADHPLTPESEALFQQLRNWRTETARPTKTPAFLILSDAVLRCIATRRPQNLTALSAISGIGQSKIDKYGADLIAITRGIAPATPKLTSHISHLTSESTNRHTPTPPIQRAPAPSPTHTLSSRPEHASPTVLRSGETPVSASARPPQPSAVHQNKRPGTLPPPPPLTDTQLALEDRLKQWRREEAHTAGLPSFFIFSDTTLRNIVTATPQTLADLRSVPGLTPDKLDRFGQSVLSLCQP